MELQIDVVLKTNIKQNRELELIKQQILQSFKDKGEIIWSEIKPVNRNDYKPVDLGEYFLFIHYRDIKVYEIDNKNYLVVSELNPRDTAIFNIDDLFKACNLNISNKRNHKQSAMRYAIDRGVLDYGGIYPDKHKLLSEV